MLRPNTPEMAAADLGFTWEIGSLADYEHGFFNEVAEKDRYISFADPSTYPEYPGWMLRNLLVLIRRRWKLNGVQILCYRDIQAYTDDAKSIVLHAEVMAKPSNMTQDTLCLSSSDMPKVTGWERNSAGKVINRVANLGDFMDPQR